ncbi:hypothetical protein BHM03_00017475 [Ensete ventricosum]|nr:hypothetical protein BHM03_00017475 [Ensete ventricosum]
MHIGPAVDRYADRSLPGGTAKIDRRWSISIVGDRLTEKSTVSGRLKKKKGKEEEKKEEEVLGRRPRLRVARWSPVRRRCSRSPLATIVPALGERLRRRIVIEAIAAAFSGGLPPGVTGTNDRCTLLATNLNPDGALLFGKRLELNFSKYPNVTPAADTHEYAGSGLNRFSNNAVKNYKYCCSPTKMIHLSSLPQDVTEEDIVTHLEEHGTILNVKLFEVNGKKQALVLFEDEEQATEALVCKHANAIDRSVIRISFSQLQSI